MSDLPKGDAALIAAINSGAPVPTNERQAGELTQRWGVWYSTPTEGAWCEPTFGNESDAIRFEQRSNAKAQRYDPSCRYEVRPYTAPSPTPPAAPGEWKVKEATVNVGWYVDHPQYASLHCITKSYADFIATRLNRADAMERALRKCMSLIGPLEATNKRLEAFQAASPPSASNPSLPALPVGARVG